MIDVEAAFREIEKVRGDAIVIPCQTARHAWHRVSTRPELDVFFRGVMGKGSSLGLGLALARPERKVIVFDGDGSLLMNLGSLATIATQAPPNLYLFVIENGVYAGTGGQPIPGSGLVSFAGIAKSCGFRAVFEYSELDALIPAVPSIIDATGPVFVDLKTELVSDGHKKDDNLPDIKQGFTQLRRMFDPR